jgi:heme-degrading monooxygenase HmoA
VHYIRLSTYDLRKGDFNELAALYRASLLPMLSRQPGFVDFGMVNAGHNKVISFSIWLSREDSEQPAWLAVDWVRENIADRVRLVNTYYGSLALFGRVRTA